jgi:hypothetical protein
MSIKYNLVKNGDSNNVTVFVNGEMYVADSQHNPNFNEIISKILADDESVVDLFDLERTVSKKFEKLSERVAVRNGAIYFDGSEVNDVLRKQVLRFVEDGVEDWQPLVLFWENLAQNPNPHSREQLYRWLNERNFQISKNGNIVGFKGVQVVAGEYRSIHSGPAIVDDVEVNGYVLNAVGSVIEMPREKVQFDSAVGCSTGLHVGTYRYAKEFARGAVLTVSVNPRDVVSVPTDCNDEKLRVCRYKIVNATPVEWTESPISDVEDEDDEYDLDEDYDDVEVQDNSEPVQTMKSWGYGTDLWGNPW